MIRRILSLLMLFIVVSCSSSEPKLEPIEVGLGATGYDTLAIQHPNFPVPFLLNEIEGLSYYIGGNLDWTFGTDLTNIEAILNTGKVIRWRTHFLNGPGLRNNQLGSYEPMAGMNVSSFNSIWESGGGNLATHFSNRVALYCALFSKYPKVEFQISPTLEHNLSERAFRAQESIVHAACPRASIVNNSMSNFVWVNVINEGHPRFTASPIGSIVSLDGVEAMDTNVPQYLNDHQAVTSTSYIWSYVFNGRCQDKFQDPRARTRWPSESMVRDLMVYSHALGPAPIPAMPILPPRIWKPWAEDKCEGDGRANKPVYITPYKGNEVKILSGNNTPIGSLKYYGTFEGGGHRYYAALGSGDSGASFARKSFEKSGSEWVYLVEGGVKFGPFHPSMRQGTFH